MSVLIMQAALLARRRRGIDPDAQAIIDRMIPEPSTALKDRLNTFVVGLKNPSLWSVEGAMWHRLDCLFVPASAQNEQSGLLDWKRPVSGVLVNRGTTGIVYWDAEFGFIKDAASNNSFNTLFRPFLFAGNYQKSDASITAIYTKAITQFGSTGVSFGAGNNSSGVPYCGVQQGSSSNLSPIVNTYGGPGTFASGTLVDGDILTVGRENATQVHRILNGVKAVASQDVSAATFQTVPTLRAIGASDSENNNTAITAACGIGLICAGAAITAAEQMTLLSLYIDYVTAA